MATTAVLVLLVAAFTQMHRNFSPIPRLYGVHIVDLISLRVVSPSLLQACLMYVLRSLSYKAAGQWVEYVPGYCKILGAHSKEVILNICSSVFCKLDGQRMIHNPYTLLHLNWRGGSPWRWDI
jgi:hypothetical protein